MSTLNLDTARARQARLGRAIGKTGYRCLLAAAWLFGITAIVLILMGERSYGLLLLSPAIACLLPALWWKRSLSILPVVDASIEGRVSVDVLARLKPGMAQDPQSIWQALSDHWQAFFLLNHLLLPKALIETQLSTNEADLTAALERAKAIADDNQSQVIELGFVVAGIFATSTPLQRLLVQDKAQPEDIIAIINWMGRNLAEERRTKQRFGGIGRDWAFGFTPLLNRLGMNISQGIMMHGAHFGWLTGSDGVRSIEAAFGNHTSAIALIGPDGIGKTTTVYALAQRLIEGKTVQSLAYHQIIAINATDITSNARGPGELEHLMISMFNEAAHAGHVILFFDNAQLFFGEGPGTFDATQILLSVAQARSVPIILAMSPNDHQRLKIKNQSLASLLTPVVMQEMPEAGIMHAVEDAALRLEAQHHVLIGYAALHEAYRLSGRYEQDEAYPGKAIKLLEQSVAHSVQSVVNAQSVQQAVEQTRGVKVGSVNPVEATELLNLEDRIHERMINQTHAVGVVASALRRARAGVTNTRRPIGSFLFLGPTGVGKTELAKAVAATYFGSESAMIRLDMSEYQQPDDVQRLLATGENATATLLMSVRQQPFAVVLLDEIEKAHPNVLNLLLQLLDEGQLTDAAGKSASFKDCIIIATSNAGAQTIRERVGKGETLESFAPELTDELIGSGQFKPELINRFDDMVLFRPLNETELAQIVLLLLDGINKTLQNQNISVELTDAAIHKIVSEGNDPRLGARPMRRALQRAVEDTIAKKILQGETQAGDHVILDTQDLSS
jgi:ATP-dependent Clp protease ATP-binding subunit ClpC